MRVIVRRRRTLVKMRAGRAARCRARRYPADELLERMIELSLYTEENLR